MSSLTRDMKSLVSKLNKPSEICFRKGRVIVNPGRRYLVWCELKHFGAGHYIVFLSSVY